MQIQRFTEFTRLNESLTIDRINSLVELGLAHPEYEKLAAYTKSVKKNEYDHRKRDLDLSDSEYLSQLPEGLVVMGILSVDGCKNLKSLPAGLVVFSVLRAFDSGIESLPPDLKVGGGIDLSDTPLREWPNSLKKTRGWVNLNRSKIERLPENFYVGNSLSLVKTPIKSLPNGLYVKSELDLQGTKITHVPDDLVANILILGEVESGEIPETISVDEIYISEAQSKTMRIPESLRKITKIIWQ